MKLVVYLLNVHPIRRIRVPSITNLLYMANIFKTQVMESEIIKPDLGLKKEIEDTPDFDFIDVNSIIEQNSLNDGKVKLETVAIKIENEFLGSQEEELSYNLNFSSSTEDLCKIERTEHELNCSQFDQESTSLEKAEEISQTIKQFKCKECDYSSSTKGNFKRHLLAIHAKEKQKRFKCSECDYLCVKKCSLSKHMQSVHTIEKSFKCSECDFSNCLKEKLLKHIQEFHTKGKPFMCWECYYLFSTKGSLSNHIRAVHSKEKKYTCSECNYRCFKRSNLISHIRALHKQEKLFKCSYCDYSSSRKDTVARHSRALHIQKRKDTVQM